LSELIPREARAYYDKGREAERLFGGHGVIELARTQEIILRHLSPPPGTVLDVGGGSGVYACWLASLGYRVHLIDAMPLHVEQAEVASARQPEAPLASCRLGDARRLDEPDASAGRRQILDAARAIEREPTLMGLHAHILAVGRKPT